MASLFEGLSIRLSETLLQNLLNGQVAERASAFKTVPPLECADGLVLSVQASDFHASIPRSLIGPYRAVEVAALEPLNELAEWFCERSSGDGFFFYKFVEVHNLLRLINNRGGLAI